MITGPNPWTGFADPSALAGLVAGMQRGLAAAPDIRIATTPKDLVWRDGKISLSRYRREAPAETGLPPLMIMHGLIGRQTISDLEPGR